MVLILASTLAFLVQAGTATQAEVLGADGAWKRGAIDAEGVIRDGDGSSLMQGAIAWIPVRDAPVQKRPPFALAELADGQIVVGNFGGFVAPRDGAEGTQAGGVSRWKHPGLGMVHVPIDRTARIQLEPVDRERSADATDSDLLLLRNGDRLPGFVTEFGSPVVIEVQGQVHEVPVERIAALSLVHARSAGGPLRVWLGDGSVLDAARLEGGFGAGFALRGLGLVDGKSTLPLLPEDIEAVALQLDRMLPLAMQSPRVEPSSAPALDRGHLPAPVLGDTARTPLAAAAVTVRGPIRLVYEVPEGFTILSAGAAIPDDLRHWGNLVLVVRQRGTELFRQPLSGEHPSCVLRVPVVAGPLEIELEEGKNGPVGDTVVLTRPLLLRGS